MPEWHLAQLNIAHLLEPLDSELLADFVANLDRINTLAEQSDGFIWRLVDEIPDLPNFGFDADYIVNLSVWDSVEALHNYVYRSAHIEVMRRKLEWFHKMPRSHMVLWWVPAGTIPSPLEAKEKLRFLQQHGPTEQAFTFRQAFSKPK